MFLKKLFQGNAANAADEPIKNIYQFSAKDIDGNEVSLSKYK